jgi:murein DD-endopeptidase MepM/ murein hydrolase activator NlpD
LRKLVAILLLALALPFTAVAADRLVLNGPMLQGALLMGRTLPGTQLELSGKAVSVSPDGLFVIGFGRDAPKRWELSAVYPDGLRETRQLDIAPRAYDIQKIDGLPEKMVTPPKEVLDRITAENKEIAVARQHNTPETWFANGFAWPATGRISGVYGSQRILNGKPRRPHYGVDVAAPEGTPITAPAEGIVRLAHPDMYYTGGTVILDHGHGVTSAFLHLKSVTVKVGDRVTQGDQIGTLGATGRATGPHLDWRINWFNERIDPVLVAGEMPKPGQ